MEGPPAPAPVPDGESEESKQKPKDPDTVLVVGIDAEDFSASGYPLTQLFVRATVAGVVAADVTRDKSAGPLFPFELPLAAPADALDAPVTVEIRAVMNMADATKRLVTTRFVPRAKKLAYAALEVRCNTFQLLGGGVPEGPRCDAPTTCIAAECRSSELGDLPDYRADWAKNPPSACGAGTSAEILLGRGLSTYAPLADGETVTLERGPQCGHHLWLALDMKDLSQWKTTTIFSATQPGSSISVPATAYPYSFTPTATGRCSVAGVRFQLDTGATPYTDFLGKPLDIKVDASDGAGRSASVTRRVNVAGTITNPTGRPCN